MKQRFINILFWLIISAAFIGPGTITTAASAGSGYGFTLIWALVFSTIACVILQEASARLTIVSGNNLGASIRNRFEGSRAGKMIIWLVLFSILLGCAAYETGNILGAVAGFSLITDLNTALLALIIGIAAAGLLWFGSTRTVAQILGIIVAIMGICFITTAILMEPDFSDLFRGSILPAVPSGSEILIIGLIGTTVVPYNLFLGSGIKHTQTVREMRWSLTLAIVLGGIVSIGVLIVGSSVSGTFTYEALAAELSQRLGGWAGFFFGIGLFAAGLSSALTAPLAASITAQSIWNTDQSADWDEKGRKFRMTWAITLGIGILFGVLQVQPIPAIILAQALNGVILPFIAIFLFLMVNDRSRLKEKALNTGLLNVATGLIVFITILLGLTNLTKALSRVLSVSLVNDKIILLGSLAIAAVLMWPLIRSLKKYRAGNNSDIR